MSGGARVNARYARMLKDNGHEVSIVGLGEPPVHGLRKLLKIFGLSRRRRVSPSHFQREGLELKLIDGRRRLNSDDIPDADILIASFWRAGEWMAEMPPSKGEKIYFVQGRDADAIFSDSETIEKLFRSDIRLLTVSRWLKSVIADEYARPDCEIIPNGVDTNLFAPGAPRLKNAAPTIGFVASDNPAKRTDLAVETCQLLRASIPQLRVFAFGPRGAPERGAVPDWVEYSPTPTQEKIAAIYAACDAWLFLSDQEGYGLPLLEAFACGTPIVARPAGAAPDLVTSENGALVESASAQIIADAAERIIRAPAPVWKSMSEAALATARRHRWADSFEKFEAALINAACARQGSVNPRSSGSK